jgi:predicted amidohydrolase YtcJ
MRWPNGVTCPRFGHDHVCELKSKPFGVAGTDPAILTAGTLALAICASFAAWLPARHSAAIEPMAAVREDRLPCASVRRPSTIHAKPRRRAMRTNVSPCRPLCIPAHRSRRSLAWLALAALPLSALAARPAAAAPQPCDYLMRGNLITLDAAQPRADWVAVRDGRIVAVGRDQHGAPEGSPCAAGTPLVGSPEATIVPGFIDSHSHLLAYGLASRWVDVSSTNPFFVDPKTYVPVVSFAELTKRLSQALHAGSDKPILGAAFDPSRTIEGKNPSLADLDKVSNKVRILVWQASMHGMNANTPMLDCVWAGLTCPAPGSTQVACTGPAPGPGVDGRSSSCTGVPPQYVSSFFHGVIEETMVEESMPSVAVCGASAAPYSCKTGGTAASGSPGAKPAAAASAFEAAALMGRALTQGTEIYASHGFTTGSDIASDQLFDVYRAVGPSTPVDLVVQAASASGRQRLTALFRGAPTLYVGPVKLFADGSIQGRTAALSQPFLGEPFYRGSMTTANWMLAESIEEAFQAGFPITVHTNGDLAIATTLDLIEANLRRYPAARGLRNSFIHAPMVNRALLERMAELNIMPTFLIQHPYLWGQPVCLALLGPQRTNEQYNPVGLAAEMLPHFALHSDAFVSPPDPLRMIWAARTRTVQDVKKLQGLPSGFTADCPAVLAPSQRITIEQALRALTLDAAYQFGLEGEKGSIEAGKLADFTVLSADPLALEDNPDGLLDVKVLGTVHRGACHWNEPAKAPCPKGR